jgi:hypothetical protein
MICIDEEKRMKSEARTVAVKLAHRRFGRVLVFAAVVIASLACAVAPAGASQTHLFREIFGSAAQPTFQNSEGLAVIQSTGDLLVIDPIAATVSRFKSNGEVDPFPGLGTNVIDAKAGSGGKPCAEEASSCDRTPQNRLYFSGLPQGVAVDESGTATDGDIYVTQGLGEHGTNLVDVFAATGKYLGQLTAAGAHPFAGELSPCGVAVGENGHLFVAAGTENQVYEFAPSANPPLNSDLVTTISGVNKPCSIAAGVGIDAGSVFVSEDTEGGGVVRIDPAGEKLEIVEPGEEPGENSLVAVDPETGHLYIATRLKPSEPSTLREYDVSGADLTLVSTSATGHGTSFGEAGGLAVDGTSGNTYLDRVVSGGGHEVEIFGPDVTVPDVATGAASITGNTSATLKGTVDPDGVAIEECKFEYGTSKSYGQVIPCAETPGEIGNGKGAKPVDAAVTGLQAETLYHVRLVVKNPNATIEGEDKTFKTPSKPELVAQWTASVGYGEATLNATINPEEADTTYRFEWGADASYGHKVEEATIDAESTGRTVSIELKELSPGATYHWRVVAVNNVGTAEGIDRTFTTYRPGPSGLPDGRVYELVSPLAKDGGEVAIPGESGGIAALTVQPQQASPDGEAITYASASAFGEGAESAPSSSQYLSTRGPDGWSTANIDPRFEEGYFRDPFVGFSPDLTFGAVITIEPPLTADALSGFSNIYLRDNSSGGLTALTTQAHTPEISPRNQSGFCVGYGGSSADSSRVFFAAAGALNEGDPVPVSGGVNLYEWSRDDGLRLVSVFPGGNDASPSSTTTFGAKRGGNACEPERSTLRHAISADGSRVFWTFGGTLSGAQNPLLARVDGSETLRLDAPDHGVAGVGGGGIYEDASADGSKVFFTDTTKLTATVSAPGSADLYRYDFDQPEGERLTDLTAGASEAAAVRGVVDSSEDGSYVYFAAEGALASAPNSNGEHATPGEENLYVWHEGEGLKFIAGGVEASDGSPQSSGPTGRATQTARVSPSGVYLAFLSAKETSGFDNTAAASEGCHFGVLEKEAGIAPARCSEVYRYDAATGALRCISCNAAGTRPLGPSVVPTSRTPYQQPRYLSDNGSVFFETADSLDPHDTNGRRDVYEFEEPGSGTCTADLPTFNPRAGGCDFLISTGSSSDESYFVDASTSGSDAFISTRDGLVPADEDGRYDVYDARIGGTPPPPSEPPACEGEGCRGAASGAPAPVGPGSSSFVGPGNPKARSQTCPKGRRKVRRHGKSRCVKANVKKAHHKAKKGHHKQAHHDRRKSR